MILPDSRDATHRGIMYRLLGEILDDKVISQSVYFKGGTCAAMNSWLDRFSVDLDFDLRDSSQKDILRKRLKIIFEKLKLQIHQENKKELFFVLKYQAKKGERNTLKLSFVDFFIKFAKYESYFLPEINRMAICQTKETMFANKLTALIERFEKHKIVAGRDVYDLWYFFSQGYSYIPEIIIEKRHKKVSEFMEGLTNFVQEKVTPDLINEDLNYLLTSERFQEVRKFLKQELLMFLRNEVARLRPQP